MTLHTPLWLQPASGDPDITYSGQDLRQMLRGGLGALAGALDTQGVVGAGSFAVTQRAAGANFSVDVAAGPAYVVGDDVAGQGTYFCWNDGVVNRTTPSAPASGTRVHRVVLQVRDKLNNGVWTGYDADVIVLPDTGGGTPAEPNSAMTVGLVSIAAGQASVLNANITDQRPVIGPAAQSYTPSWTGLSALGSGFTVAGAYIRQGKLCTAWARLTAGSSPSLGTGGVQASLPFPAASGVPDAIGTGVLKPNPGRFIPINWHVPASAAAGAVYQPGATGSTSGTVWDNPGNWGTAWVAGAQMYVEVTYITA